MRFAGWMIVLAAVGFAAPHGLADEDASDRAARVKVLIEMLASKNMAPRDERDGGGKIPADYDKQGQAAVFLASQQLLQEGAGAFDELVKHLDDKRYSYSYEAPSGTYNVTVGSACFQIIQRNIYCYEDLGRLRHFTRAQRRLSPEHTPQKIKQWWAKNRQTPLWKIQVAEIDNEIALMRELKYDDSPSIHPYAKKVDKETFEKLRLENIKILGDLKVSISMLEEPYRPKSLAQLFGEMTALPWPTKNWGR